MRQAGQEHSDAYPVTAPLTDSPSFVNLDTIGDSTNSDTTVPELPSQRNYSSMSSANTITTAELSSPQTYSSQQPWLEDDELRKDTNDVLTPISEDHTPRPSGKGKGQPEHPSGKGYGFSFLMVAGRGV